MPDHKKILSSKKSVHINIEKETHADMRGILFKKDLTMQDFFSSCAAALASEETYFMDFLDEIKREKENIYQFMLHLIASKKKSGNSAEKLYLIPLIEK